MFEQLVYKNHINEEIRFGQGGIFVNENELHDYDWKYNSDNNKVSNFNRGVRKISVPVIVACPDPDDGVKAINNLMEIAEKDVLSKEAGRFIIGDYYFKAYITGSKKKKYSTRRGWLHANLTVVSDYPAWVKETSSSFTAGGAESGKDLDFTYDFPYDFTSPNKIKSIINPSFADVDFKLIIYGEVDNPSVTIGGNEYKVNCRVNAGEYLTINSKEKSIYVTRNTGEIINRFKDRSKDTYIFTKIPSGELKVSWNGTFGFDVTLYEERSEPKWT